MFLLSEAMADDKPISLRRDPRSVADMLLKEHGVEKALKRIASEKANARRARSRQRFQFWDAISQAVGSGATGADSHSRPDRRGGLTNSL
jgi:hypothetical protein